MKEINRLDQFHVVKQYAFVWKIPTSFKTVGHFSRCRCIFNHSIWLYTLGRDSPDSVNFISLLDSCLVGTSIHLCLIRIYQSKNTGIYHLNRPTAVLDAWMSVVWDPDLKHFYVFEESPVLTHLRIKLNLYVANSVDLWNMYRKRYCTCYSKFLSFSFLYISCIFASLFLHIIAH